MRNLDSVFDSIINLKDNWNGYGAEPFNSSFVNKCREIVKGLIKEPFVAPTANNSIQLEYEHKDNYLEIELFEDKANIFKYNSNGENLTFVLLKTDNESLNLIINSFYQV